MITKIAESPNFLNQFQPVGCTIKCLSAVRLSMYFFVNRLEGYLQLYYRLTTFNHLVP